MGTPREPMRLVGNPRKPRLVTVETNRDFTEAMATFSQRKVREIKALALSGFVFKKDSPSCGVKGVWVFNQRGLPTRNGIGLFARAFMEQFPLIPVEEDGRLSNRARREHFIEQVLRYYCRRNPTKGPAARKALIEFHAARQSLPLTHRSRSKVLIRAAGKAPPSMKRAISSRRGSV